MYMDGKWMDVAVYKSSYDAKGRESLVDIDSEDGMTRTEYISNLHSKTGSALFAEPVFCYYND